MTTVYLMTGCLLVGTVVGLLVGVNNPTIGAATKKLADQAKSATASAVDKLKS